MNLQTEERKQLKKEKAIQKKLDQEKAKQTKQEAKLRKSEHTAKYTIYKSKHCMSIFVVHVVLHYIGISK